MINLEKIRQQTEYGEATHSGAKFYAVYRELLDHIDERRKQYDNLADTARLDAEEHNREMAAVHNEIERLRALCQELIGPDAAALCREDVDKGIG